MAMGNVHFIYTMCFIVNSGNVGSISSVLNLFFFSVFLIILQMSVCLCGGVVYVYIILIVWDALKDSDTEEVPRGEKRYNSISLLWHLSLSIRTVGNDSSSVKTIAPLLFLTDWTHSSFIAALLFFFPFRWPFPPPYLITICLPSYSPEKYKL